MGNAMMTHSAATETQDQLWFDAKEDGDEEPPPAVCPIDCCMEQVAHSHLLRHIMSVHMDGEPKVIAVTTEMKEVPTGAATLLMLSYRYMPPDRDLCLAVLNWQGDGCLDLSVPQRDLSLSVQELSHHVPVLVMVCWTTWKSVLTPPWRRIGPNEKRDLSRELGKILLIWLLCPAIRRPVAVNLGIINSELKYIMLGRRLLRSFGTRVHINDFLAAPDPYFIQIDEEDLEELCDSGRLAVFLEVVINGEVQPKLPN